MGEQIPIVDLARQMIELSGLTVRDNDHPQGDISIKFTGLRPGEKLFEELFISGEAIPSDHPLIWRVNEPFMHLDQLTPILDELTEATARWDVDKTLDLLHKLVPELTLNDTLVSTR